jgi:hypothetical protein
VKGEDKRRPWAAWFHSASCSSNVCRVTLMIYVWNKTCFFFCFGQTALFPDHAWLTQCVLPNVDISCEVSDARARRNLEAYYIHVGECICIYVYYSSLSIQTYRNIYIYDYICIWKYIYICVCYIYIYMDIFIYMDIYIYGYIYIWIYIYNYVFMIIYV